MARSAGQVVCRDQARTSRLPRMSGAIHRSTTPSLASPRWSGIVRGRLPDAPSQWVADRPHGGSGLGASSVWSRSRLLVLAVAVAATPTSICRIRRRSKRPGDGRVLVRLDRWFDPGPRPCRAPTAESRVRHGRRGHRHGAHPRALALLVGPNRSLPGGAGAALVAGVVPVPCCEDLRSCNGGRRGGGRLRRLGPHPVVYPLGLPVPSSMSSTDVLELALGRIRTLVPNSSARSIPLEPCHHCSHRPVGHGGVWTPRVRAVASLRRHAAVIMARSLAP